MNQRIVIPLKPLLIGLLMAVFGATVFAQDAASDISVPSNIRNNKFFLESVRLANLAAAAFEESDYDASIRYSEEAIKNALLSDEWVRLQLLIRQTDDAITQARFRLEWAVSPVVDAVTRFPQELYQAQTAYVEAQTQRSAERWDAAIAAADKVISILASLTELPKAYPLPAQYMVIHWDINKDCLWNIAGQPWAYNDPTKWPLLHEENRSIIPQADNPHLIHPGIIIDIPSIAGETREGMYVEGRNYMPLP
jgi:hypothetical protein